MKLPNHRLSIDAGASELAIERRPFFETILPVAMAAAFAWLSVALFFLGIGAWWAQAFELAAASLLVPSMVAAARRDPARWIDWGLGALVFLLSVVGFIIDAITRFLFIIVGFWLLKALGFI